MLCGELAVSPTTFGSSTLIPSQAIRQSVSYGKAVRVAFPIPFDSLKVSTSSQVMLF